jgi:hypothetical protein
MAGRCRCRAIRSNGLEFFVVRCHHATATLNDIKVQKIAHDDVLQLRLWFWIVMDRWGDGVHGSVVIDLFQFI